MIMADQKFNAHLTPLTTPKLRSIIMGRYRPIALGIKKEIAFDKNSK